MENETKNENETEIDHPDDKDREEDADKEVTEAGDDVKASSTPMLHRPIKRARTAYFIFRDEKNAEVKASLPPGSTVGVQAKAVGQLWAQLNPEEKQVYQEKAAMERERVSNEIKAMEEAGLMPPLASDKDDFAGSSSGSFELILPVARMRKIAKLDPEVRGIGKEAISLITYATELFTRKLGLEANRLAQIQNRRKLLPEDVAEACSTREQFIFLNEDIRDLQREMLAQKNEMKRQKQVAVANEDIENQDQNQTSSKPITDFFNAKSSTLS